MAYCVAFNEQGFIYKVESPLTECSSMVIQTVAEYNQSTIDIAPSDVALIFSWAFGAVVVIGWLPGYCIGIAKKVISLM